MALNKLNGARMQPQTQLSTEPICGTPLVNCFESGRPLLRKLALMLLMSLKISRVWVVLMAQCAVVVDAEGLSFEVLRSVDDADAVVG